MKQRSIPRSWRQPLQQPTETASASASIVEARDRKQWLQSMQRNHVRPHVFEDDDDNVMLHEREESRPDSQQIIAARKRLVAMRNRTNRPPARLPGDCDRLASRPPEPPAIPRAPVGRGILVFIDCRRLRPSASIVEADGHRRPR